MSMLQCVSVEWWPFWPRVSSTELVPRGRWSPSWPWIWTSILNRQFQSVLISFNQFQSVSISFIVFTSNHCNHWLLVFSFVSNLYTFFILLCSLCGWQAGCTWYVIKWLADEQSRFPVSFLVLSSLTSQIKSEWKLPCFLGGIMLFGTRTVDNTSCLICCASSPSVKKATVVRWSEFVHLRCKLEVPVDDGKAWRCWKMLEDLFAIWCCCDIWNFIILYRLSSDCLPVYLRCLAARWSSDCLQGRDHDMGGALSLRDFCSFENPTLLHCVDVYFGMFLLLAKIWVWSCLAYEKVDDVSRCPQIWRIPPMHCLTQAPRRLHHLRMELHDRMKYYMEVKRSTNHVPCPCHAISDAIAQWRECAENVEVQARTCALCFVNSAQEKFYARVFGETPFARPDMIQFLSDVTVMCSHVFTFHRQVSDLAKLQHCNNWSQRHTAPRGTTVAWCWMGFGLVHGHPSFSNQATRWRGIHVCIRANCDVLVAWEYHTCGNMEETRLVVILIIVSQDISPIKSPNWPPVC